MLYRVLPLTLLFVTNLSPLNAEQAPSLVLSSSLQQTQSALAGQKSPMQDVRLTGNVILSSGTTREAGTITMLSKSDGTGRLDIIVPSGIHSVVKFPFSSANASVATDAGIPAQTISWRSLLKTANWFFPEHMLGVLTADNRVNTVADQADCSTGLVCVTSRIITTSRSDFLHNGRFSEMTVSLDPQTKLPMKLEYSEHPGPQMMPEVLIQVRYGEYQVVEGHNVPMHLQQFVNGFLRLDIHLTTVDLHTNLSLEQLKGEK